MLYHVNSPTQGTLIGLDYAATGIPSEADYVAAYCRRTGRAGIDQWDFYVAFSMFRLSAIAQGIMGRVVSGTANDPHARSRGSRARPLAERAWAIVEAKLGA
jgi:aminoglycoside phosphotransferase (APT) family kinase protein